MQSISDKAHGKTQLEHQVKPLLPVFPDHSSFKTHVHDSSKSPIQLQDANVPPVIQHKLNTMLKMNLLPLFLSLPQISEEPT